MTRFSLLLTILLLGACGTDDGDGDGWSADQGDCDDADPAIHPGAGERCDGFDNDCDALVDEADPEVSDTSRWYTDADADGYGDETSPVVACTQPTGVVDLVGDCDDSRADVYPGAPEEDCTDSTDRNCDGVGAQEDGDGDGWLSCKDCDDTSSGIHPGARDTCNEVDDDCDGLVDEDDPPTSSWLDADGDGFGDPASTAVEGCSIPAGYIDNDEDCDDAAAGSNPDATEECDGVDDDCDGEVDEADAIDVITWYADADGDGYGDPDSATKACDRPSGTIKKGTDCDDTDPAVFPGAPEICADEIDQNCDGEDKQLTTYFLDNDGDGYGAEDSPEELCTLDAGYSTLNTDCDDYDATSYPGGTEVCDGADNDCDGSADDGVTITVYRDEDEDGYGSPVETREDCDASSGWSLLDTDCDDSRSEVSPLGTEIDGNGLDDDCDGTADSADLADYGDTILGAAAGDSIGLSVCAAGDVDGDGFGDLWIDASLADDNGTDSGVVYLLRGPLTGGADLSDAVAWVVGENTGDRAGSALATGDLDGDGVADLVVGASKEDTNGTAAGAVYLLYGALTGEISLADADAKLLGEAASDWAGFDLVLPGDVNDDGVQDLWISAMHEASAGAKAGATYLMSGVLTGEVELSSALAKWVGESSSDQAGVSITSGDMDGDGLVDLVVGADGDDATGSNAGAVYLLSGMVTGDNALKAAATKLRGVGAGDHAGHEVESAGDMNDDGYVDLLVAAPDADGVATGSGVTYLLFGPVCTSSTLSVADVQFLGESNGDQLGMGLGALGDVDGDGWPDIGIGAYEYAGTGAAWIIRGPLEGTYAWGSTGLTLAGISAGDDAGRSLGGAGDLDGDGLLDAFVGSPKNDDGGADAGLLTILYGGGLSL